MNSEMMEALENIEREKGISVEIMLEALANALVTAYKRMPNSAEEALVEIDIETGDIKVIAQELDEEGHVVREWDDTPNDFGRIAAQTAKQVILQRIRDVERESKYEEYAGKEGELVTGIIQQTDSATRCSTSEGSRRCCRRPSRCRTSATSTAAGSRRTSSRSARRPRARRSSCRAPTRGS